MKDTVIQLSTIAIAYFLIPTAPSPAQVIGDQTLPINTVVNLENRTFTITGGTEVNGNQFHSFQQFSVPTDTTAHFNNHPDTINIISRVTGNSISHIDGLLKTNGQANLWLINPNGVVFGKDAQLQIGGSFTASTANSIKFPNGQEFSATNPQAPPVLTISTPIGLQYGKDQQASISNAANLNVGKDLTLSAGNVSSVGSLTANQGNLTVESVTGDVDVQRAIAQNITLKSNRNLTLNSSQLGTWGNLDLMAKDTIQIRDTAATPFIAEAGGNMNIQGNQLIDIFALNHPNSGFYTNGNMVFRSANTVIGDAHYYANGNFRIEQLDGNKGNLASPTDPIIRSLGDVTFGVYLGQSLHIIAGGRVSIDTVGITGADTSGISNTINPTSTPSLATVNLSPSKSITINGNTQPTLDIRAGVSPSAILSTGITGNTSISNLGCRLTPNNCFYNNDARRTVASSLPSTVLPATGSAITIGNITVVNPDGLVLLTNNYAPNLSLAAEDITVTGEGLFRRTPAFANTFKPSGVVPGIDLASTSGNGGSLFIDSRRDIIINENQSILTSTTANVGNAGEVYLQAQNGLQLGKNLSIWADAKNLGGNISLLSNGAIDTKGLSISSISSGTTSSGRSGDINIKSTDLILGKSDTRSSEIITRTAGSAIAGSMFLQTDRVLLQDETLLSANTVGKGNAGNIVFDTQGNFQIDRSIITTSVSLEGEGKGGDLTINAKDVSITNGAQISSGVGSLLITTGANGKGDGGNILIKSDSLTIDGTGAIAGNPTISGIFGSVNTGATGKGGTITAKIGDTISISNGGRISSSTRSSGNAGVISLTAKSLDLTSGAKLRTETLSSGDAGKIELFLTDRLSLVGNGSDILSSSDVGSSGAGGSIFIDPAIVTLKDGARISVSNLGLGDGGNISLIAGSLSVTNSSIIAETANGKGGNITLQVADLLWLRDRGLISATAGNNGDGGNININANFVLAFATENSDIFANAFRGRGGNINITTQGLFGIESRDRPTPFSDITASSQFGLNGTVLINTPGVDPSKGLGNLPADTSDASSLISQRCLADNVNSKFFITGRGGLPPSPLDQVYRTSQILPNLGNAQNINQAHQINTSPYTSAAPANNKSNNALTQHSQKIIEAQGWIIDQNNQVSLVSDISQLQGNWIWSNQPHCISTQ
ncbi:MAG: filamentous hemagglutinin N-terminal domain-containing protein [Pseudanabaenaceae cyanobacterium bins.39]|nr:filamentous hemagglutinin N-terminal domain-containing protein [Pseudanabaenaceae cyanobacterium bins.39]